MQERSASEWAEEIERWKHSGQSRSEYAAQSGLKKGSLSYWKWHFETKAGTAARRKPRTVKALSFVEVEPSLKESKADASSLDWYEVTLANGTRVRLSSDFDAPSFSRLVELLERRR